jgi:hypothetical protein
MAMLEELPTGQRAVQILSWGTTITILGKRHCQRLAFWAFLAVQTNKLLMHRILSKQCILHHRDRRIYILDCW